MSIVAILPLLVALGAPPDAGIAEDGVGRTLVCRGYEDSGNITEDQPIWPCHLITLFVTGKNPHSAIMTPAEHVAWATDSAHSYIDDGTGGLVVWAHPGKDDAGPILATAGLTGIELSTGGIGTWHERTWDKVLTGCHDADRPYLWGFAADDTHSKAPDKINLSFVMVRMGEFTEKSLKASLRGGAFFTSNGPLIDDIQVKGGTITIELQEASEVHWLRSGQFGAGEAVVSREPGENHCLKRDVGVRQSSYTLNDADGTSKPAARFIRALVIDPDPKAEQWHERLAQTMPFRIRGAEKLDNPYPAGGRWFRGMTHNHSDQTGHKQVGVFRYREAYYRAGHRFVFATDYGYWLTPFRLEPDRLVKVMSISPDRGRRGQAVETTLIGARFDAGSKVLIGGRPAAVVKWLYENRLAVTIPDNLPVGVHDVTVIDPTGFKDTLSGGYSVQSDDADTAGWTTWTTRDSDLPGDRTFCVAFEKDGTPWIGTQYGAARFNGRKWHVENRLNNASIGDAILSIAADRKGNVWFGHFRGLTQKTPGGDWSVFRTEAGMPSREVNRILVDQRDSIWVNFNGRSAAVSHYDGEKFQTLTPPNAAGARYCVALAEDAAGRILVSPQNRGVAAWDGKAWEVTTTKNSSLPDDYVRHIRQGPDGTLYFATTSPTPGRGGLAMLRDGKWTIHKQSPVGLASYRVWDVCVDRAGNVWCATSCGVCRLDRDGKWHTFTTANSGLAFDFVMGVAEAPDGAMWFATARGVSRFRLEGRGGEE